MLIFLPAAFFKRLAKTYVVLSAKGHRYTLALVNGENQKLIFALNEDNLPQKGFKTERVLGKQRSEKMGKEAGLSEKNEVIAAFLARKRICAAKNLEQFKSYFGEDLKKSPLSPEETMKMICSMYDQIPKEALQNAAISFEPAKGSEQQRAKITIEKDDARLSAVVVKVNGRWI